MEETYIESTCCYLIHEDEWLMLYRNKKKNDVNAGKWIGVGGKREEGESNLQCAVREIREETGISVDESDLTFCGTVYFLYDFKDAEKIALYTGHVEDTSVIDCSEGDLAWIEEKDILSLNLWEGDRIFLKRMLEKDLTPFTLFLHYNEHGDLTDWKEGE